MRVFRFELNGARVGLDRLPRVTQRDISLAEFIENSGAGSVFFKRAEKLRDGVLGPFG